MREIDMGGLLMYGNLAGEPFTSKRLPMLSYEPSLMMISSWDVVGYLTFLISGPGLHG